MSPVINRHEGQDNVIDANAHAVAPWDEPGDAGQCHLENLAALSNTFADAVGDPEVHVPIHLRFLRSPLGQKMPKRLRERLISHVFDHIAAALVIPGESGIPKRPIEEASELAALELAYRNGKGG